MRYLVNKTTIYIVLCLMFFSINIYASNIGRTIYGIYTETYNGVGIEDPSAGNDRVTIEAGGIIDGSYTADKLEGTKSLQVGAGGWMNFKFANGDQDMSDYIGGRIYFSFKAPSGAELDKIGISILAYSNSLDFYYQVPIYFNNSLVKRVDIEGTGAIDDGEWHTYYIELASFVTHGDLDLSKVKIPFVFQYNDFATNKVLVLMDNAYWAKAPSATRSFNVTVKNISNNQETTDITWANSCFRAGWKAADQYMELDLDYETSMNWNVRILLDNDKATRNGLYCVDGGVDKVLQMAWRITRDLLPNSAGDTLQIAQAGAPNWGLYDSGKNQSDPWWYPWAYFKEKKEDDTTDYSKVWDKRGCHTFIGLGDAGANNEWKAFDGMFERKPKIYLCANCTNAEYNLNYVATIDIILNYE